MPNDSTAPSQGREPNQTLDRALIYAKAGVRVLPLGRRTKVPAVHDWPRKASTDPAQLRAWFTVEGRNLGLAMGAWAGSPATYLVCIDLDRKPDCDGVAVWQQIVADNGGDQGRPFIQHSAGGGLHLIYQVRQPFTNSLGGLPADARIDVRGEGGQLMVEPSVHPNGRSPRWDYSANWATSTPGMAPDWLHELLAARHTPSQPEQPPQPPALRVLDGGTADRPGDRYNATHTWHDTLTGAGWNLARTSGPDEYWVRPGKDPRHGHSAVLHTAEGAHGVLVVFTTECPPGLRRPEYLTSDGSAYKVASPWAWHVATSYNGDHSQAASEHAAADRQADSERLAALTAAPSQPAADSETDSAADPSGDAPPPGHTYQLRNLAEMIGQPDEPTLPTLLLVEGSDLGVMYRGHTNLLAGPSGSGKTWALMVAVLQQARLGHRSVVLDYEMTLRQWYHRLRLLGATDSDLALVSYCQPGEPTLPSLRGNPAGGRTKAWATMRDQVLAIADQGELALVALDGVTNALAGDGLDPNSNAEVARWWQAVPDYLARLTGAGVIVADHTPRHADPSKSAPLGAQHKVSAASGAVLMAEVRSQMAREPELRNLHLHLRCVKDRHGEVGQGDTRHELVVRPADTGNYGWGVHLIGPRDLAAGDRDKVLRSVHAVNAARKQAGDRRPVSLRAVATDANLDTSSVSRYLRELMAAGEVVQIGTPKKHNWQPAPATAATLDY